MKKLFFLGLAILFTSCSLKDKEGNAPLIEDENGYLVDNPNYHSDAYYKASEIVDSTTEANKDEVKEIEMKIEEIVPQIFL